MPKRKNAPKAPPASVEDRRDRNLRVVHREEMTATVGDVLEHLHTDAAIELLYAQDNLAAGRDLNDPTALMGEPVVSDDVEAAKNDDSVEAGVDAARDSEADDVVAAEKTGTPAEQLAATIVTEAGAAVSEAVAAASVVKAAATSIAEKVTETVAAVTAPKVETANESARVESSKVEAPSVETETTSAARDRAREENAAEARVRAGSSSSETSRQWEPVVPAKPASMLRFLSPRFVIKATRDAVGELVGGVRQARNDLREATVRARQCFVPSAE